MAQKAISNPAVNLRQVAALVQSRCEILSDLPERVDFIDKLPDYEPELYIHKKSKTNLENSLETLTVLLPVLQAQDDWSNEALYETLVAVAAERGREEFHHSLAASRCRLRQGVYPRRRNRAVRAARKRGIAPENRSRHCPFAQITPKIR